MVASPFGRRRNTGRWPVRPADVLSAVPVSVEPCAVPAAAECNSAGRTDCKSVFRSSQTERIKVRDSSSGRISSVQHPMILPQLLFSGERTRLACWFWRPRRNHLLVKGREGEPPSPAREPRALPRPDSQRPRLTRRFEVEDYAKQLLGWKPVPPR